MTSATDLLQLGKLVAQAHGWDEARAFKAFEMTDADRARIAGSAVDLLKVFPKAPGSGPQLAAAFAVQLGRVLSAPIQVVAGTLTVDGVPVLGNRQPFSGADVCAEGFRGHAWVMVGPFIAELALFRRANESDCPPALARHVHSVFGHDKGLYVDQWRKARKMGLGYEPQCVLSGDEVDTLMAGAFRLIKGA
jgi:hypothetical protein